MLQKKLIDLDCDVRKICKLSGHWWTMTWARSRTPMLWLSGVSYMSVNVSHKMSFLFYFNFLSQSVLFFKFTIVKLKVTLINHKINQNCVPLFKTKTCWIFIRLKLLPLWSLQNPFAQTHSSVRVKEQKPDFCNMSDWSFPLMWDACKIIKSLFTLSSTLRAVLQSL